ncbi:MAG: transposase [Planctomycetota bacterium]
MPARKIYDAERHAHFLTFSCRRRRRLLDTDDAKRIVIGQLGARLHEHGGFCGGFVVMPNHVHALVWFDEPGRLSDFMRAWKTCSSKALTTHLKHATPKYAAELSDTTVWQSRYYDFNVFDRPKFEEKLDYMHLNPVRAGFVERATDWKWSSARWYLLGKAVGIKIEAPPGL